MIPKGTFLRAPGNYDAGKVSLEAGISFDPKEGLAQQQFKEECDINVIVERFGLTGELPDNLRLPVSGDFTGISDYQSALNAVRQAEEQFLQLPGDLRERFAHNPQKLLSFLEDDRNRDEAEKLGLVTKPPEKTRDMVQAIDELSSKLTAASGAVK